VKHGKMARHVRRNHKNETIVQRALNNPQEKRAIQEKIRVEGIHKYNLTIMTQSNPDYSSLMRERKPKYEDSVVKCANCDKYISNRAFYKHKIVCGIAAGALKPVCQVQVQQNMHKDEAFKKNILCKFRDTPQGNLCRQNDIIKQVGFRHFCLRRTEESKMEEIRKSVMSEMRELARLFLAFQTQSSRAVTVEDMFTREHKENLYAAIETLTEKPDGDEKHGLKLQINAVVQRAIKSLRGYYNDTMQDQKALELDRFKQAYNFRSPEIFAKARYQSVKNSLDKARCPENLPLRAQLQKLRLFTLDEIQSVVHNFSTDKMTWLRSLIVSLLTLWNARRGEEGSRILISEWQDARMGRWIPPDQVEVIKDEAEKHLVGKFKLAYLHGKGRKFVPVLIPNMIEKAINLLVEHREMFGIVDGNPFVFATKGSKGHASGWHALYNVSSKAGARVNATANRHYISTVFAGLEMSPDNEKVFMDHMGHDAPINKDNYQCPQGVKEVKVMGKLLLDIYEGESELAIFS